MLGRRLALSGALGRMGRLLAEQALRGTAWTPVQLLESPGHPRLGEDGAHLLNLPGLRGLPLSSALEDGAEAVVDFSTPEGLRARLAECVDRSVPLVSGTTGADEETVRAVGEAARSIPVMHSPNMSLGVNLLYDLVARACRASAGRAAVEIVELHHGRKEDAPSGTACELLRVAAEQLGGAPKPVHGRSGRPGPRTAEEVGLHALRGGTVTGEHTVLLLFDNERIELTHRAENRSLFADGALWAAEKLLSLPPGLYTPADLLRGDEEKKCAGNP